MVFKVFSLCYPISVRNRKSEQPCAQAFRGVWSQWWAAILMGGGGGKHWGIEIRDRPRVCFLPWKPCPFCLEIYCRVGGAGLLGSCTVIVVWVWLHPDVLLLLWVHWRKGVWRWEWPEDWRLWLWEGSVRIWLERSLQLSFLSVDVANDALMRQCLPFMSDQHH